MPIKGSADGGAPGPPPAVAEALGEMIAPPELALDGASESDECSDEEKARAAAAGLCDDSATDEDSDAEDVLALNACEGCALEKNYESILLYRWLQAVREWRGQLRDDALLPLHPGPGAAGQVWADVDQAVVLPSWRGAFGNCAAASAGRGDGSSREGGLRNHAWTARGKIFGVHYVEV